jgi:hypothetical protein
MWKFREFNLLARLRLRPKIGKLGITTAGSEVQESSMFDPNEVVK